MTDPMAEKYGCTARAAFAARCGLTCADIEEMSEADLEAMCQIADDTTDHEQGGKPWTLYDADFVVDPDAN